LANQWIATDSALNPFVQNFFARLPCPYTDELLTASISPSLPDAEGMGGATVCAFGFPTPA
jgi:hypothetical protein